MTLPPPLTPSPDATPARSDRSLSDEFSVALAVLLESALVPSEVERLLVLIHGDQQLEGILGTGWDPRQARECVIDSDDEVHPVAVAFRGAQPVVVHLSDDEGGLLRGRYLLLPLQGRVPLPFGALLIGPEERELASFAGTIAMLNAIGPALERIAELFEARRNDHHKRERDFLKAALDALPDPVFVTDSSNRVLLHNRRATDLFSSSPQDNEGRRRAVEINNLFFSSFLTQAAIGESNPAARELNLVDPSDGADLLIEALVSPGSRALDGGEAKVSVLRDVTDLKSATTELEAQFKRLRQVEAKSRRERDRLNMILENVGGPILVTDESSNIILLNREAERLFDVPSPDETELRDTREVRSNGMRFSSFISDFALSADRTRIAHLTLTDPETGLDFPAEAVSGKVLNDRSEVEVVVSILHDLTEVVENRRLAGELARLNEGLSGRIRSATRELEERNRELEAQSRELEKSYRLQTQFLASMSHELRTPINSLMGYISLLRDRIYGEMSEPQQEAMERMHLASHHLMELVDDILDLAKIEAGKMPVHVDQVDLGPLIREVTRTVDPMVRRKELALHVDIAQDLPIIATDSTKVRQIILNLLSNAVKFTREGEVRVRAMAACDGDAEGLVAPMRGVSVSVSDTGIGIAESDIKKIFEDFRQIDESATREHGGTGLGLSITGKLLQLLGGTIQVDSVVGEGTTFTICLPLRSDELRVDAAPLQEPPS